MVIKSDLCALLKSSRVLSLYRRERGFKGNPEIVLITNEFK